MQRHVTRIVFPLPNRLLSSGLKDECITCQIYERSWNTILKRCLKAFDFLFVSPSFRTLWQLSGCWTAITNCPPHPKSKSHGVPGFMAQRCSNTKPCSAPYRLLRILLQADARLAQNKNTEDKGVLTLSGEPILLDIFWVSLKKRVANCVLLIGVLEWTVGWSSRFRTQFFSFFIPYLKVHATV